jgi:signal transduction histidine kinase
MSIRFRLVALAVAILMPAGLAVAWGIGQVYQHEREAYETRVRATVRALALLADTEIVRRREWLETLAASPDLRKGDLARFYAHARATMPDRERTIVLNDPSGQQLMNTRQPFGASLPRSSLPLPIDRPYVSNLYFAPIGKAHSFAVAIPVQVGGKGGYSLAMGSYAAQLQAIFERQRIPEGWSATILDREGRIVARNSDAERLVGQTVGDRLMRRVQAGEAEGSFDGINLAGTPVLAIFARAPESGWTFVLGVPSAIIGQSAARAAAWTAIVGGVVLAFALLAALFVGRGIHRSVRLLVEGAARMGRGEGVGEVRTGMDETDRVARALAEADRAVRESRADMERRVADAKADAENTHHALLQSQKLEALGRLTGCIAHDFNNLLQTLKTGVHVLEARHAGADKDPAFLAIRRAVDRAAKLTRQLMTFSRAQRAEPRMVSLASHLLGMADLLRNALGSRVQLRVEIPGDLAPVMVDPLQLELAIVNAAINARDAMPEGGSFAVRGHNGTGAEAGMVVLALADTGQGMPPEVLARAFEPFFTTKEVGKGSGLGLAQVYGFAQQAGGSVRLESEPGRGTIVRLLLPNAAGAAAAAPDAALGRPATRGEGLRVLMVEDDALVREIVAPSLQALGFEVSTSGDAAGALELLSKSAFDVVFSDVVMPGSMDGIALAQMLAGTRPGLPVVLATGYAERPLEGDWKVLAKPYDIEEAARALREAAAVPAS